MLLPALVLLMGLVALGALYAGFAAARAVGAGSLAHRARPGARSPARRGRSRWRSLVILAGGLFHGDADDASVFGVFLIGGALLGRGRRRALGQRSGARGRPALVVLSHPEGQRLERPPGLGERLLGVTDQLLDRKRPLPPAGGPSPYAPGRIRTCDLALRRRALYPLSYGRSAR